MATLNPFDILPHMVDGLAVYDLGHGPGQEDPLLLMPGPEESGATQSARSSLALLLVRLGKRVITFDPPGSNGSASAGPVDDGLLVRCALKSLDSRLLDAPVGVVAWGAARSAALALARAHGERVARLVLVGGRDEDPLPCAGDVAGITAPALIYAGDGEGGGVTQAVTLAALLPNARLVTCPQGGGAPHDDRPLHFGAALQRFLPESSHLQGKAISVEL